MMAGDKNLELWLFDERADLRYKIVICFTTIIPASAYYGSTVLDGRISGAMKRDTSQMAVKIRTQHKATRMCAERNHTPRIHFYTLVAM